MNRFSRSKQTNESRREPGSLRSIPRPSRRRPQLPPPSGSGRPLSRYWGRPRLRIRDHGEVETVAIAVGEKPSARSRAGGHPDRPHSVDHVAGGHVPGVGDHRLTGGERPVSRDPGRHCVDMTGPPARWIAPSTPPPLQSQLAAFTTASTFWVVMSPWRARIAVIPNHIVSRDPVPPWTGSRLGLADVETGRSDTLSNWLRLAVPDNPSGAEILTFPHCSHTDLSIPAVRTVMVLLWSQSARATLFFLANTEEPPWHRS